LSTKVFITGESGEEIYMGSMKQTNPKDAIGSNKLPIHLWPETATLMGCMGLLDGMLKYGRSNYRAVGVRASIYVDACRRHLTAWFEGEEYDPDSGLPHLAHALACLAILVDAQAADQLTDDRQIQGGYRKLVGQLTPHVGRLKELHADKSPKHYTIKDRPQPAAGEDFFKGEISGAEVPGSPLDPEVLEKMMRDSIRDHGSINAIWQEPYRWPPVGEVTSKLEVRRNADGMINSVGTGFDDDEIAEMCRLAKSNSVTIPLT